MKKIPTINFLKLRASWGQLGNQYSSDNFPYIAKIGYDGNYVWGNEVATGVVPTSYGNPDIHWETTNVTNIGLIFICSIRNWYWKGITLCVRQKTFYSIRHCRTRQDSNRC